MGSNRFCFIQHCRKSKTDKVTLHCLPSNPVIAAKWRGILKVPQNFKKIYVCSEHFLPDDFSKYKNLNHKNLAVWLSKTINLWNHFRLQHHNSFKIRCDSEPEFISRK
jgi:hypothetical protein